MSSAILPSFLSPGAAALDTRLYEQARLSRDPRFDGLFFTAVTSTGIYCRPVCPAPAPKRVNVRYFGTAAAAENAGFRPCLRCRPELAPGHKNYQRGDDIVTRALTLIDEGLLADVALAGLAARLGIGERQLRRLFVERLGAAPLSVHTTRRLLFAKQLLTETALPITEIALAAGFGSLRRFNAVFRDAYRLAPRTLRRHAEPIRGELLTLRLGYRPPYDFKAMLDFLRTRALPGIERVGRAAYERVFGPAGNPGWLRVSAWPNGEHALQLQLYCRQSLRLLEIVTRLRRLFDLDADPTAIAATLGQDARLASLLQRHPGLRLPGGWDGFEIAVRAVLGQQVSVAAARTLATRLMQNFGVPAGAPVSDNPADQMLDRLFPSPENLAEADLACIGVTRARAETLRGVARALLDGRVSFRREQTLEEFVERWTALPGIGPWTAHYIALRALSQPDAFPAADLVLRRAAATAGKTLSTRALEMRAEAWRPWRAYAVMHLWRAAAGGPG